MTISLFSKWIVVNSALLAFAVGSLGEQGATISIIMGLIWAFAVFWAFRMERDHAFLKGRSAAYKATYVTPGVSNENAEPK